MGKIAAIGGGRYENGEIVSIVKDIRDLCDKPQPKMLFIPTAGHDNVDGDEFMEQAFRDNGCTTDRLFLTDNTLTEEQIKNSILSADIIYVGGGDVGFMMRTWQKTGADKYLVQAYNNGTVMSGYSAGAVCWFDTAYDDCGKDHAFIFVKCLGLFPFCCCPHAESESWQSFTTAIKSRNENGIAIENGAALIFDGENFRCVCGNEGGDVNLMEIKKDYRYEKITDNPNVLKNLM